MCLDNVPKVVAPGMMMDDEYENSREIDGDKSTTRWGDAEHIKFVPEPRYVVMKREDESGTVQMTDTQV